MYLFFPVLGGAFNSVNKKIRKHESIPAISPTRVCLKSCGKGKLIKLYFILFINLNYSTLEEPSEDIKAPVPNRLIYMVAIKLKNLAQSFETPVSGSVEFNNLAASISDSLNTVMNNVPRYYKTEIVGFSK